MSLILSEVLDHPLLQLADPVILSGHDNLDHTVRWVHSADLLDIAPLLRGGEVLLTNGVGLVGVDQPARRHYVRSLAEIGVAALLFEVGRTFAGVPEEMVDEATEAGLTIVQMRPVLRFTDVAEAVNSELIDRSVIRLRHADETSRALSVALARGASLRELVGQVAATLGSWAQLRDRAGRLVEEAGAPHDPDAASADAPVLVDGAAWGRLVIGTDGAPELLCEAVLDRAPTVLGLCLIREHKDVADAVRAQQILLEQLVGNRSVARGLLEAQLAAAGVAVDGHEYVCLVADLHRIPSAEHFVDKVIRQCGHGIFGVVRGSLCAVVARSRDVEGMAFGDAVRRVAERELGRDKRVCAVVGRRVQDVSDVPRAMADAHATLELARELHISDPVIEVQQLALQRLLDGYSDRETLRQFVNEQIGMLDDSDKRRSGQLLQTLEVLVACAGNKLEAARRLHIRRQSLYYRLEQIQRLTGCNLDDAQQLLPMAVALTARTMLTTGR
ncbi:PucR family transcriptional regulator ligand-binding domain-containing protein [Mycobacterium hodleri]|uniref:PucR family transcriptional regulator n=1 Tax=Mycolicibacterium hodleri TaxID=49897 RepID=UPI0021F2782F|nr:PucR family transcriptional regulator [Mycolicibacterium hodleri]MCV7134428.1 PucR family transcriptional regulator ligand-binding domain-containing protein [Mycolicibacterium hodleri]